MHQQDIQHNLYLISIKTLETQLSTLPADLGQMMDKLLRDWHARLHDHSSPSALFSSPLGTPALPLLQWLAECLGSSQEDLQNATTAMLCCYLAVRCQDDIVDEGANPQMVYLQQALDAHSLSLLVPLSGHPAEMITIWAQLNQRFAAASARDATLRANNRTQWFETDHALQGHKYLPMALPLLALALRANQPTLVPLLQHSVEQLGIGLQLLNDVLGAERDLRDNIHSPWLRHLSLNPALHTADDINPALRRALRAGTLDKPFTQIQAAYDAAAEMLAQIGGSDLFSEHLDQRRAALRTLHTRLMIRATLKVPTVFADLELTRRCNLRCPDCFVFAQEADMQNLAELPLSVVFDVLEELSGYRTLLHLTGGEPMMHPDIWDIFDRAVELGFDQVMINSNGLFLNEEVVARMAALPLTMHLLISIDGPPGIHERARGRTTTQKTLSAIRRARKAGLNAQPASILSDALVAYGIGRWRDWLTAELGDALPLTLWPLFIEPSAQLPRGGVGEMLNAEQLREAARQIAALMLDDGPLVTVADYPVINPLLVRFGVAPEALWQCTAGQGRLCVQADLTVTPCHPFRLEVGRLSPDSIPGFVARTLRAEQYQTLGSRQHDGCSTCSEQPICGNCQAVVVGKGFPLFSNDRFCRTVLRTVSTPN